MDDLPTPVRHQRPVRRFAAIAAVALLTALVGLPSTAGAEPLPVDPRFGANEVLVARGPWTELAGIADAYWARRGLGAGCPATIWVYTDSDPSTAAIGEQPGCNIGLNRGWLRYVRSLQRAADRYGSRARMGGAHPVVGRAAIQRHLLAQVCVNVVHERGHNIGLAHSADPRDIMYRRADRPPTVCRAWAAHNWRRFDRLSW